jgi:hypothetical protein
VSRRFFAVYALWILGCAIAFVILRGAEDPSRRHGRILSTDAAVHATAELRAKGIAGYSAVHVGYARRGEAGSEDRWIVLCDRTPHTQLREALVVELRAGDGSLLTIRKPAIR